jgi:hypothetical protein
LSVPLRILSRLEKKSLELLAAAGYESSRASLGAFHVVGIGRTDIVLVHLCANRWPDAKQSHALQSLPAPRNAKKLIHLWRGYARIPEVKEIK